MIHIRACDARNQEARDKKEQNGHNHFSEIKWNKSFYQSTIHFTKIVHILECGVQQL